MSYILCFSLYSNRDGDSDDRDQCPMWTFPTVRPSSMNKLQKGYTNTDSEVRIPTFHSCFRNEMTVRFVSCHYRSFKKKKVQNNNFSSGISLFMIPILISQQKQYVVKKLWKQKQWNVSFFKEATLLQKFHKMIQIISQK